MDPYVIIIKPAIKINAPHLRREQGCFERGGGEEEEGGEPSLKTLTSEMLTMKGRKMYSVHYSIKLYSFQGWHCHAKDCE